MDFYNIYKSLCVEIGKSATGVALELGVHKSTVTNWKNGGTPRQEILNKLANYFCVSTDYLLGNTNIKNPPSQQGPEEIAKVALFGGDSEVTEEMWQEVKDYVEYIKQKHHREG